MATLTFPQLLSSDSSKVQCCFMSTETIRSLKDGEPRTATSTFTQLQSFRFGAKADHSNRRDCARKRRIPHQTWFAIVTAD